MKRALLFDLDGTLFDTTEVNYCAYKKALNEVGCDIDRAYYKEHCDGRSYRDFLPKLCPEDKIFTVHERKKILYGECLEKARENTFLFEMIVQMKKESRTGVVTTASRKNVEDILTFFSRETLFDVLICQEDVVRTKPDPEAYCKAMECLGVTPDETVIFEDSQTGLEAALASGAQVIKIERF